MKGRDMKGFSATGFSNLFRPTFTRTVVKASLAALALLLTPRVLAQGGLATGVTGESFARFLTPAASEAELEPISVEVPELYELMHVILAVSDLNSPLATILPEGAETYDFLVDNRTPYFAEVEKYFGSYRDHPFMAEFNETYLPMVEAFDIEGFLAFRYQVLTYELDEQNRLVPVELYVPYRDLEGVEAPAFDLDDPATQALLTSFIEDTGFSDFYAEHQDYYNSLIQAGSDLCNFSEMKGWLEANFPVEYDSYRIIYSPLTGGSNETIPGSNEAGDLFQTLMFVPTPHFSVAASEVPIAERAEYCQAIFTEIDHGYVNPVTDQYLEALEAAMPDYKLWSDETLTGGAYGDSYATFNEYMTYAAYPLFMTETLPEEDQAAAIRATEDFMVAGRGFNKFKEFNQELLRIYQEREAGQTVADLYPALLEWMTTQN